MLRVTLSSPVALRTRMDAADSPEGPIAVAAFPREQFLEPFLGPFHGRLLPPSPPPRKWRWYHVKRSRSREGEGNGESGSRKPLKKRLTPSSSSSHRVFLHICRFVFCGEGWVGRRRGGNDHGQSTCTAVGTVATSTRLMLKLKLRLEVSQMFGGRSI